MRKEYWRPVVGYEGLYEVSNYGRVKSLARVCKSKNGSWRTVPEKILTPSSKNGYLRVLLYKNGKATIKQKQVHRLVWEAFKGEIPAGMQVNHIDENKKNNCLWNLNLMTPKENSNWGTRNERFAKALSKPVVALDENRNIVYWFPSISEAGRNDFNRSCIGKCCYGKRKTHKGLFWQWA